MHNPLNPRATVQQHIEAREADTSRHTGYLMTTLIVSWLAAAGVTFYSLFVLINQ